MRYLHKHIARMQFWQLCIEWIGMWYAYMFWYFLTRWLVLRFDVRVSVWFVIICTFEHISSFCRNKTWISWIHEQFENHSPKQYLHFCTNCAIFSHMRFTIIRTSHDKDARTRYTQFSDLLWFQVSHTSVADLSSHTHTRPEHHTWYTISVSVALREIQRWRHRKHT